MTEYQQQVSYGWNCKQCTFLNLLSNHRCEMCNHSQMHTRNPVPVRMERLIDTHSMDYHEIHDSIYTTTRSQKLRQSQLHNYPNDNPNLAAVVEGTARGCIVGGQSSNNRGRYIPDGTFRAEKNGAIIEAVDSLRQGNSTTTIPIPTQNVTPSSIKASRLINTPNENYIFSPRHRQLPANDDFCMRSFQNMINSGNSTREITDSLYESPTLIPDQRQVSPSDDMLLLELFEDLLNSDDLPFHRDTLSLEDIDYELLLSIFGDGTENMGASQTEIESLPTHTIKSLEKDLPSIDLRQCAICLDDFKSGDERKLLPCFHGYHKECIDHALRHRATCPLCNSSLHKMHYQPK
jgi:hypothetical protein